MKYMAIIDADEKPVSCEFIGCNGNVSPYLIGATDNIKALEQEPILDKIRSEIEQLPTNTRINWDGCCPDVENPEIEYIDVPRAKLLKIIDRYKAESGDERWMNKD